MTIIEPVDPGQWPALAARFADTTYAILEDLVVDVCAAHPGLRVVLDTSDVVKHLHGEAGFGRNH